MALFNWKGGSTSVKEPETGSQQHKREFCELLDSRGMYYDERDGDPTTVIMRFGGGSFNFDHITVFIDFDPNSKATGDTVHLVALSLGKFEGSRLERGLELCNDILRRKRWVRPYIDDDGDLDFDADMFIGGSTAASDTFELVQAMVSIIDDVYPDIQRA